jgi:hypothetical protein
MGKIFLNICFAFSLTPLIGLKPNDKSLPRGK